MSHHQMPTLCHTSYWNNEAVLQCLSQARRIHHGESMPDAASFATRPSEFEIFLGCQPGSEHPKTPPTQFCASEFTHIKPDRNGQPRFPVLSPSLKPSSNEDSGESPATSVSSTRHSTYNAFFSGVSTSGYDPGAQKTLYNNDNGRARFLLQYFGVTAEEYIALLGQEADNSWTWGLKHEVDEGSSQEVEVQQDVSKQNSKRNVKSSEDWLWTLLTQSGQC
ncbi:hypothetical protein B0J13DRAFT_564522 [Dactylonectria estremocensis]|uniref:Uncharacterized protein n=1 Tax=Dactylonectria estremocensis TaxID=1079267 RepID=A0A9P9IP43_9HYPO|nr:hypothetical protein B0J13DRAFT_564522 [Dactylonectria estremocensis]